MNFSKTIRALDLKLGGRQRLVPPERSRPSVGPYQSRERRNSRFSSLPACPFPASPASSASCLWRLWALHQRKVGGFRNRPCVLNCGRVNLIAAWASLSVASCPTQKPSLCWFFFGWASFPPSQQYPNTFLDVLSKFRWQGKASHVPPRLGCGLSVKCTSATAARGFINYSVWHSRLHHSPQPTAAVRRAARGGTLPQPQAGTTEVVRPKGLSLWEGRLF